MSRTNVGRTKGSRCHKELISNKLDFGNWIPNDYVLVLFKTGNCNGGDRHLIATADDEDDKERCKRFSPQFKYWLHILTIYSKDTATLNLDGKVIYFKKLFSPPSPVSGCRVIVHIQFEVRYVKRRQKKISSNSLQ